MLTSLLHFLSSLQHSRTLVNNPPSLPIPLPVLLHNLRLHLSLFLLSFSWVFLHEKAYQVRDSGIESSVMTKVKGFGYHNNRVMDVADYVAPTQVCDTLTMTPNP